MRDRLDGLLDEAALVEGFAEGRLEERLAHYAKPELLIFDELGYLPFEPAAVRLWLRQRSGDSVLVTGNRSVDDWGAALGDPVVSPPSSTGCCATATC